MPGKQPRRARLWLNEGSCIRPRPERPNHVWAYGFVLVRTQDGRAVRLLTVINEYTRESLAIRSDRHITSSDVIEALTELMVSRGVPDHMPARTTARSLPPGLFESGSEQAGAKTLYIEPGSPWENGCVESFNGKLRDGLPDREIFYTLQEMQALTGGYRQAYNRIKPHTSLGYKPPAPGATAVNSQPTNGNTAPIAPVVLT